MSSRVGFALASVVVGIVTGCATPPPPAPVVAAPVERPAPAAPAAAPMPQPTVEPPPTQTVMPAAVPETSPPVVSPPPSTPPLEPLTEPPMTPATTEPTEEQQLASVLVDLQRYGAMTPEELRREQNTVTQLLARQRTDFNRIRLAILLTLAKTPQDDQRAVQLLDSVAKSNPGSPAAKQLAAVVQVQVAERMRAVRDEQQKADAAVKKLEALRNMERDLLRDRIRSGGGRDRAALHDGSAAAGRCAPPP